MLLDRASLWGAVSRFGRSPRCSDSDSEVEAEVPASFKEEPVWETRTQEYGLEDPKELAFDLSPSFCSSLGADPGSNQETAEDFESHSALQAEPESHEQHRGQALPMCVEQPSYTPSKPEGGDLASAVDMLVSQPRYAFQSPDDAQAACEVEAETDAAPERPGPIIPETDMPMPAFRGRNADRSIQSIRGEMPDLHLHGDAFVLSNPLRDEMSAPHCMFGRSHVNILARPEFLHGPYRIRRSESAPNFMVLIGRGNCVAKPAKGAGATMEPARISGASAASRSSSLWDVDSTQSLSPRAQPAPPAAQDPPARASCARDAQAGFFRNTSLN